MQSGRASREPSRSPHYWQPRTPRPGVTSTPCGYGPARVRHEPSCQRTRYDVLNRQPKRAASRAQKMIGNPRTKHFGQAFARREPRRGRGERGEKVGVLPNPAAPIRFPNDQHPTDGGGSLIKRLWLPVLISFDDRMLPDEAGAFWRFAYIQMWAQGYNSWVVWMC